MRGVFRFPSAVRYMNALAWTYAMPSWLSQFYLRNRYVSCLDAWCCADYGK
jgi:hypothetical protein